MGISNLKNLNFDYIVSERGIYRHRGRRDPSLPASEGTSLPASEGTSRPALEEPAARRLRSQPSASERSHTATELRPKGGVRPRSGRCERSEHSKAVEPVAERRVASEASVGIPARATQQLCCSPPPLRRREDRYGPGRGGGLGGRGNGEPRELGSKPCGV